MALPSPIEGDIAAALPLWIPACAGLTNGGWASPAFASLRVPIVDLFGLREGDGV